MGDFYLEDVTKCQILTKKSIIEGIRSLRPFFSIINKGKLFTSFTESLQFSDLYRNYTNHGTLNLGSGELGNEKVRQCDEHLTLWDIRQKELQETKRLEAVLLHHKTKKNLNIGFGHTIFYTFIPPTLTSKKLSLLK